MTAPTLACVRLAAETDAGAGASARSQAAADTAAVLQRFSPQVAAVPHHPGLYFLDVGGMVGLYPSHESWATALMQALEVHHPVARLVVGYSRFCLFVLAHTAGPLPLVLHLSRTLERAAVHRLPLAAAPLGQKCQHLAQELGLRTLGCLLRLPQGEVAQALGGEALTLHRLAHNPNHVPLAPLPIPVPCAGEVTLEPPDHDSHRLLFACKGLLPKLVAQAQSQHAVLAAIDVTLVQEAPCTLLRRPAEHSTKRIEAGRPGRQEAPWLDLMRLALEAWSMPRAVQTIRLTALLRAPPRQQLQLWPTALAARDTALTTAAISQLRARFGDAAVTCARLQASHLPEQQFAYAPVTALAQLDQHRVLAKPRGAPGQGPGGQSLVRRLLPQSEPLPQAMVYRLRRLQERSRHKAPHLRAVTDGDAENMYGPFRLSHGWWQNPCDRDYYYLPSPEGAWLWVFFDRQARAWRLQGVID